MNDDVDAEFCKRIGAMPIEVAPFQWERVTHGAQMIALAIVYAAARISNTLTVNAERRAG